MDLVVAGGEVAVPEQGQLLAQRVGAVEHAIKPPRLEALGVVRLHHALAQAIEDLLFLLRRLGGVEQPVDAGGGPVAQIALQFAPGRPKARPPVQVGHLAQVPRFGRGRLVGRTPRVGWSRKHLLAHGTTGTVTSRVLPASAVKSWSTLGCWNIRTRYVAPGMRP